MEFKREVIIQKSIEEVWEVLGNQYSEAYQWASGLYHSEGTGAPKIEGASCDRRSCDTSQGKIKEVIRIFDPQRYILSYEVIEGFPSFVYSGINTWRLSPQGNHSKVTMHLVIKTSGLLGFFMAPMMKLQLQGVLKNVTEDLRHYVEKGRPSPRKAKEMKRLQKKAA
ncbi:MAG: SRPBCC family protein [Bacteroidota bacterium]